MDEAAADTQEIEMAQGALDGFDMSLLNEKDLEIDQMIGEIDLENDMDDVPSTFEVISKQDFPIFTTYKKFLVLLDSLSFTNFYWSYYNRVLNHRKSNPTLVPRDRKMKYSALAKVLESSLNNNQGREWLGAEHYPEDGVVQQQDEIYKMLAESDAEFYRDRAELQNPRAIIRLVDRRLAELRNQLGERLDQPAYDQLDKDLITDMFENRIEEMQRLRDQQAEALRQAGVAVPNAAENVAQENRDQQGGQQAANPQPLDKDALEIAKLQESGIDPREFVLELDYEAFETQAIQDILEGNEIKEITRRDFLRGIHPRELWGQIMKNTKRELKLQRELEDKKKHHEKDHDLIKKLNQHVECLDTFEQSLIKWKLLNGYYDLNDVSSKNYVT